MSDRPVARRWGALPTAVVAVDLEHDIEDVTGLGGFVFAMVLVRVGIEPVGIVRVPVEGDRCPAPAIAAAIAAELVASLLRVRVLASLELPPGPDRFEPDALARAVPPAPPPPVATLTVAVCTRDRVELLDRCLAALLRQRLPARLLVVDNAPSSPATADLVAARYPDVSYVLEPRPGLDHARNRALAETATDVLAYTDDDVVVDDLWTSAIVRAFDEEPHLGALTGLVLPLELDTPAQHVFERLGGFGRGVTRRWVAADGPGAAGGLLGTGQLGTGANMAFRRSLLLQVGGFDPALDVGTPTRGAGDLDVFHRVLAAGASLRYEPAAIAFHRHRRSMEELALQVADNGSVWAMLMAARDAGRATTADVGRVLSWYVTTRWPQALAGSIVVPNRVPPALPLAEVRGMATAVARRTYRRSQSVNGVSVPVDATPAPPDAVTGGDSIEVDTLDVDAVVDVAPGASTAPRLVVITRGGAAVGRLELPPTTAPIGARQLREAIVDHCGAALLEQPGARSTADPDLAAQTAVTDALRIRSTAVDPRPACSATIVIATMDRPDDLAACLSAVVRHRSSHPFDVVVVDNHPSSGATAPVLTVFPTVIPVVEERRGASYARNAGILRATGDVVVTIDDDVRVPDGWLDLLLAPFRRNDVMAVCGNIQPLELSSATQIEFERISPLSKGFRRFEATWEVPARRGAPFAAWELGATANAAFRRTVFDDPEIGLMDEALGPGMPSGVGEDSYLVYRIVRAGFTVVYEPTAFVWHRHRDTPGALVTQITNYYSGHVCHQMTTLLHDADPRAIGRLARVGAYVVVSRAQSLVGRGPVPAPIARAQLRGAARGPLNYVRSRRRVRRDGPSREPLT